MFHLRPIQSLDEAPELAPYRTMKRPAEHVRERIFVAEGDKVVELLLASNFEIVSALMPTTALARFEPLLQARTENIPVFTLSLAELEKLVGFKLYQGVLAVGRYPATVSLRATLERSPKPWLLVALEGLTNAENLGVIIRNCAAFGVHALVTGETCTMPFLRRSVRNSMGTIFKLPVIESPALLETIRELRLLGVKCVAAHVSATGATIARADLTGNCCIILGSEGYGLSPAVLEACDEHVAIPMASDVDSINVGNAAAVFLYEAGRQRGRM